MLALNQVKFARLVGCQTPTLQAWENGVSKLSFKSACRISVILGLNVWQLMANLNPEDPGYVIPKRLRAQLKLEQP